MTHLTVDEVLSAHAEVGRLNHDMVKEAMGPNWPKHWNENTAIFDPPAIANPDARNRSGSTPPAGDGT